MRQEEGEGMGNVMDKIALILLFLLLLLLLLLLLFFSSLPEDRESRNRSPRHCHYYA